jgi:ribonucleotide reductase beta subunit family protein with ferritin-like domain
MASSALPPNFTVKAITAEACNEGALVEAWERDANSIVLRANDQRFVLFPIRHPVLWKRYKDAEQSVWTADEVDLSLDVKEWPTLQSDEQHFIKHVLAFFASADGLVQENLASRFFSDVQIPEARSFYATQIFIENVHSETYSILIDALIKNSEERQSLFEAVANFPAIRAKAKWAEKWITSPLPFRLRLAAFIAVEGIFFSGSFCAIFWLKKRNKMPGLTFSNELISRDEGLHCLFGMDLMKMLPPATPQVTRLIQNVIQEAVQDEIAFICEALPVKLIGMNSDAMATYIKYVADQLLVGMNCPKVYNAVNPFDFMEMISLDGKTNFFERRVGDYSKRPPLNAWDYSLHDDSDEETETSGPV